MNKKPEKKPAPDNGNNGKRCWQLYSLQRLSTDKFIDVVEKILRGEHELLNSLEDVLRK